jgi:hypothetical protein
MYSCLPPALPLVCLALCGLRPWRCDGSRSLLVGGIFLLLFSLVCLGFMSYLGRCGHFDFLKMKLIKSSPSSLHSGDASSIVGGCVEVDLWWISLDLVHLLSDLRFSSLVMDATLVCWSFGALARRLPVSTTTSSFSTSFARLQWGRGVDGGTPSARLSSCNRRQVVQWPPPIGNKCQQFCTSLVQSLYYVPDSYFWSEGVLLLGFLVLMLRIM